MVSTGTHTWEYAQEVLQSTRDVGADLLMRASQNRSSSALSSLSVGSIIRVLMTGQDMVGPWKPAQKSWFESTVC